MTMLPGLAQARIGYQGPPPWLIIPAEDGTTYARACHRRAAHEERHPRVLCREHGLVEAYDHADVHYPARLCTREDVRRLADLVRSQVSWITSPIFAESWLWPTEESALSASRRIVVVRSPLAGLNVLERMSWLGSKEA